MGRSRSQPQPTFATLPEKTLQDLLKPENKDKLAGIVKSRVVATEPKGTAITKTVKDDNGAHAIPTVAGGKIIAKLEGDKITLTEFDGQYGSCHRRRCQAAQRRRARQR